jgi:poly-D-alanine transfer protein DltD
MVSMSKAQWFNKKGRQRQQLETNAMTQLHFNQLLTTESKLKLPTVRPATMYIIRN